MKQWLAVLMLVLAAFPVESSTWGAVKSLYR